jgi:uncharacterized protein YciI
VPRATLTRLLAAATVALWATNGALAQIQPSASPPSELPLFAVEITTGSKWDQSKPAHEQQFFRDHSSSLKRLRESGALIMGARYSDKGLVVLAAKDEAEARAMMDEDPSIKAEVFKYQVHSFNVFYSGTLNTRARKAAQ